MKELLRVDKVRKVYGNGAAVNGVSFTVEQGEFVGIMGASGSGKSTLLNLIATIDTATAGEITVDGRVTSGMRESETARFRRDLLGFVFQDYNLLDTLTLRENIALALTMKREKKNGIDARIDEIAQKLGILPMLEKFPYEVSGGQRQRCACARAVAVSPKLVLADEPTGALDSHSARELMDAFVQMNTELGATILMVTHDALSACYCGRVLFMKDGKLARELVKGKQENPEFIKRIFAASAALCGGEEHVC